MMALQALALAQRMVTSTWVRAMRKPQGLQIRMICLLSRWTITPRRNQEE